MEEDIMKRKHRLREQLTLEIIERKNRTTVNIIDRGKTIQLAKVNIFSAK